MTEKFAVFGGWLRFLKIVYSVQMVVYLLGILIFLFNIIVDFNTINLIFTLLQIFLVCILILIIFRILGHIELNYTTIPAQIQKLLFWDMVVSIAASGILDAFEVLKKNQVAVLDSFEGVIVAVMWYLFWFYYFEKSSRVKSYYTEKEPWLTDSDICNKSLDS